MRQKRDRVTWIKWAAGRNVVFFEGKDTILASKKCFMLMMAKDYLQFGFALQAVRDRTLQGNQVASVYQYTLCAVVGMDAIAWV